jgi:hypothetical protein
MTEYPMRPVCLEWLAKIELAKQSKEERFGKYAREAMQFFDGAHDWMWDKKYSASPGGYLEKGAQMPTFRMTVNRVFEIVALFGPALYWKNPNITVSPLVTPEIAPEALGLDPNDLLQAQQYQFLQYQQETQKRIRQSHSAIYEHYLNWAIVEGDLKTQSRFAITEALVKGMSLTWIEVFQPKGSSLRYPRAVNVSVDDFVVDPDATCWEDVQWCARRCEHPVNLVEQMYGLPPGTLKGHKQSAASQATEKGKKEGKQGRGSSFDLIEYWKIWSKNGFGQRLANRDNHQLDKHFQYEMFGDNCFVVVARDVPYPLNIPPQALAGDPEELVQMGQWPIPFWLDEGCGNGWPFSRLYFYDKPGSVWPISLIKPAIGEMRFINWCMSFLADKVAQSCTTYLGVLKSAAGDIQKQLADMRLGNNQTPFTLIELSETLGKPIDQLVKFLDAPDFQEHIWRMVAEVNQSIDKRIGLTELLYGLTGTQIRSATEADVKDQNLNIRPDDMASKTEDWLSETALKTMEAARWELTGDDMRGPVGDLGAYIWDTQILTGDVENVIRDFHFRVEAGSARKPNKNNKVRTLQEFAQVSLPVFQEMAMAGNVAPWNAYIQDWAKANDLDPSQYLLQPPDPASQPPSPEEMEMQLKAAESQMKQQEMKDKLTFQKQEHQQTLRQDQQMHEVEMAQKKQMAKVDTTIAKGKLDIQKKQLAMKKKAMATQGSKK